MNPINRPKRDYASLNTAELEDAFYSSEINLMQFITYAKVSVRKFFPLIGAQHLDKVIVDIIKRFK